MMRTQTDLDEAALAGVAAAELDALLHGRHPDPFALLGRGSDGIVRVLLPGASEVHLVEDGQLTPMQQVARPGLFAAKAAGQGGYQLDVQWPDSKQRMLDPYAFGLLLSDTALDGLRSGDPLQIRASLGARAMELQGHEGVGFAVWAPAASRVAVIGDFNGWDSRRHAMRLRHEAGVWELFVPGIGPGERYKYALLAADGSPLPHKADPVARATECPPATASVVGELDDFGFSDDDWMHSRSERQSAHAPLSVYEVHVGSWMQDEGDWASLTRRLIPYAVDMGFTHLELLPVTEHPFAGSWGYQPLGMFAPSARYGTPHDFARFVDACHQAGLGVIVDWVPAHFPADAHGLARFDGSALYEHGNPLEGWHQDWQTLIYNHGRVEVAGWLIASALEWLQRFHIDGLRVDAVASMLYRDYSRAADAWVPNVHGGRENYEAVAFLRQLNETVHRHCPGAIVVAEESTAWPGVSAPVGSGGLGFDFKWNMGWMHDSLQYIGRDPIHRSHHHDQLTFGMVYAYSERFMLPISHDEVVHGKGSLLGRMPGDDWQKMANLRAYLVFMWTHPGKKLLFMGCEFGQLREWNHDTGLDWHLLDDPRHRGVQRLLRDLNALYRSQPALHAGDNVPEGFQWLVADDSRNSVLAFLRLDPERRTPPLLVVINFTPQPQTRYRVGVPQGGVWRERLNSDAACYGGSGVGNADGLQADALPAHGHRHSVQLSLPPLGALLLQPE